jgi:hypothetical protein
LQERIVLEGNCGIKQLLKPIVIVTVFALVYQALPLLGAGDALIINFILRYIKACSKDAKTRYRIRFYLEPKVL